MFSWLKRTPPDPQPETRIIQGIRVDVLNTVVAPAPSPLLTPMIAGDHDHFQMTTLAPPAVPGTCGCVTLAP